MPDTTSPIDRQPSTDETTETAVEQPAGRSKRKFFVAGVVLIIVLIVASAGAVIITRRSNETTHSSLKALDSNDAQEVFELITANKWCTGITNEEFGDHTDTAYMPDGSYLQQSYSDYPIEPVNLQWTLAPGENREWYIVLSDGTRTKVEIDSAQNLFGLNKCEKIQNKGYSARSLPTIEPSDIQKNLMVKLQSTKWMRTDSFDTEREPMTMVFGDSYVATATYRNESCVNKGYWYVRNNQIAVKFNPDNCDPRDNTDTADFVFMFDSTGRLVEDSEVLFVAEKDYNSSKSTFRMFGNEEIEVEITVPAPLLLDTEQKAKVRVTNNVAKYRQQKRSLRVTSFGVSDSPRMSGVMSDEKVQGVAIDKGESYDFETTIRIDSQKLKSKQVYFNLSVEIDGSEAQVTDSIGLP